MEPYLEKADTYFEPFVGGCNMMDKIKHKKKIGTDSNPYLIAMWNALKKGWIPPGEITKDQYEWIKSNREKKFFTPAFVGFIGHNCSFSGDWFAGYAGTGETRNRCLEAKNHLLKQILKLQDVHFSTHDYKTISGNPEHWKTLYYCDPPYYHGFKYKGARHNFNHEQFWEWCRKMVSKGNYVFVSDYHAPDDFELVWHMEVSNHAHQTKKKNPVEKLYKLVPDEN